MKQLYFLYFFLLLSFLVPAQTKLTIVQRGQKFGIDEIKIERFSNQKFITYPAKDSVTIEFDNKFADLYTFRFYSSSHLIYEFQAWLDTGNPKLIISKGKDTPIEIGAIEKSPITDRARKFAVAFKDLAHGADSAKVNEFMLETYKQNLNTPLSFYVGEFYYNYNKSSTSNYLHLNALESLQKRDLKQSLFYAMMLRRRFTFTEQKFFDYFKRNQFVHLFSSSKINAFDSTKVNILLFLSDPTTESIKSLQDFYSHIHKLDVRTFNILIAVDEKSATEWKGKMTNDGVAKIVVPGKELQQETTFLPITKFYFIKPSKRIIGYYDTMQDILKEAGLL